MVLQAFGVMPVGYYALRVALNVTDAERTVKALQGIEGKRLMYRPTSQPS